MNLVLNVRNAIDCIHIAVFYKRFFVKYWTGQYEDLKNEALTIEVCIEV